MLKNQVVGNVHFVQRANDAMLTIINQPISTVLTFIKSRDSSESLQNIFKALTFEGNFSYLYRNLKIIPSISENHDF